MHTEPKVEMSLNRFELISRWGEQIDHDWAHAQLEAWLRSRVDLTQASVYDSGQRGEPNAQ